MCLYPKIIQNRKYIANKKNKGIIPQMKDKRVQYVPVACGNCMECRKRKTREWQVRLQEEIRENKKGIFITLTFSEEALKELSEGVKLDGYNLDNEIARKAVRRFLERWRKKYKKSVRHWLVTELGKNNTERLHLHGIIFTEETGETISKIWKYGIITIGKRKYNKEKKMSDATLGYISDKSINYIVKYIHKTDEKHKEYKPKILCSQGIGKGYKNRKDAENNKYKGTKTKETYTTRTGVKLALPIYYRNAIYTEEQREKLWIQKLDENIRWVDGRQVAADDERGYYKLLEQARKKNKKLGYGDNTINWDRKRYENERRNIIKRNRK